MEPTYHTSIFTVWIRHIRRNYCCAVHIFFFVHLKWLLLFFFYYIELNQLDEYFCIADAATAALVIVCISCARSFSLWDIDVASILVYCYLRIYTLVTVGPLRCKMFVFPIHLSFVLFHGDVGRHIPHLNHKLKENIKWKDQRYNDSSPYIILYFIVVVVVIRDISACKEKKESIILLHFTLHFFIHLSFFNIYPY